MTAITPFERPMLSAALGLPFITSLGLMFWAPGVISPTTYAVVASLLIATAAIVINTWKGAQGTGSVGQLLYDTERPLRPTPRRGHAGSGGCGAYDKSSARGTARRCWP